MMRKRRTLLMVACLAYLSASCIASAQVQDRGSACTLLPPLKNAQPSGNGKSIALYMQIAGKNRDIDDQVRDHLQALGYNVTEIDQAQPAESLKGYAMVLLSSSVSARYLRYTLRDLPVPLMTWEFQMLDQLGMVGRKENVDAGKVEIEHNLWFVNAPHPASAGLPPGKATVYTKAAPMTWGKPGLGASNIATLPGEPNKVVIFTYEKGATMDDESIAPARRVFWGLDDRTFSDLNACGLALFDADVAWTLEGR